MDRPMRLFDLADGVHGHYCIGRLVGEAGGRFWQYYSYGSWLSAGQVFTDKDTAERLLSQLKAGEDRPP